MAYETEKKIAVLLPCYNEAQTVEKVVRDFLRELPTAVVYVYNNNSTDRTAEIAASIDPRRVVVRNEYRQGKGNVIRSMFRDIEADCYLMADGDDTYPAEHARDLVAGVLGEGCDMVIGDRLSSTYFTENKRPFHNTGNVLVRRLVNRLFHGDITDIMTGYRAFSRDFVKMTPVLSAGFEVETEMTINALDKRFRIKSIPIQYRDRPLGSVSKLHTLRDGTRVLRTILTMCRDYRPMLFFGVIALLSFLLGVGFLIPALSEYAQLGLVLRSPALAFSAVFFLASLLFLATGSILTVIVKKDRQNVITAIARLPKPEERR